MYETDKSNVIQPFTKRQIFGLVQIESIRRRQYKCTLKRKFVFRMGRKHCGKR